MASFTQKLLSYNINGTQAPAGLRSTCRLSTTNGPGMGTAEVSLYGMTLSDMNALTTLGTQINQFSKNPVTIQAGDANGMSLVFQGTVQAAFVDAQAMPEVCFRFTALAGGAEARMKAQPTSVQGAGDVATIGQQLAQKMGLAFEGNNVNVKLQNLYLPGSLRQQAAMLAEHAGVTWVIERGVLAMWIPGQGRQTASSSNILSKDTGMVGYPAYGSPTSIIVNCLFRPELRQGDKVTVQSELTPACGTWEIMRIDAELEALTPHGKWFSQLTCMTQGEQTAGDQG